MDFRAEGSGSWGIDISLHSVASAGFMRANKCLLLFLRSDLKAYWFPILTSITNHNRNTWRETQMLQMWILIFRFTFLLLKNKNAHFSLCFKHEAFLPPASWINIRISDSVYCSVRKSRRTRHSGWWCSQAAPRPGFTAANAAVRKGSFSWEEPTACLAYKSHLKVPGIN